LIKIVQAEAKARYELVHEDTMARTMGPTATFIGEETGGGFEGNTSASDPEQEQDKGGDGQQAANCV
jgi:hypothetical protein